MALPPPNKEAVKSFNQKRKSKFDDDHNFHLVIAPGEKNKRYKFYHPKISSFAVLTLAQFFGQFPIRLLSKDAKNVCFKWMTLQVVFSCFWLSSASTFVYLELRQISYYDDLNPKNIS